MRGKRPICLFCVRNRISAFSDILGLDKSPALCYHTYMKWLYERDYKDLYTLSAIAEYWMQLGYRVFIQGYSAMDCWEVR